MSRCDHCGQPLEEGKAEGGMCPPCFEHCYNHHARLTALNRTSFLLLLALLVLALVLVVFPPG